ncbi:MAG: flagellin [Robiginitomaculum sp.]|nr:flagellin [Robiginitomaculum sp.]MDQ7078028.1 flagellin [Robiginitomaculum sp.]
MTISVNSNTGALVALQNLNATNRQLESVQNRISTGLKVSNAKDNGGAFAIAQKLRADVRGLNVVEQSLSRVGSLVDVASAAGQAISDLLVDLKEKALAATDTSLDSTSRTALNEDFKALRDQIKTIVNNASFNGSNLINNSTNSVQALASASGSTAITILDEALQLSGSIVIVTTTEQINTITNAKAALTAVNASLTNVNAALARLGTKSKALEIQSRFVTKLSDALTTSIGNLVDADLAKESAKLQSLQVKQQLGVQALSIANKAPQTILGFFQ